MAQAQRPLRILFVCSGNICRSPLAEAIFRHLAEEAGAAALFELDSAGTHGYHEGDPADPRTRAVAEEHGIDKVTQRTVVKVDPRYFRPTEVDSLLGDPTKARMKLGWKPELTFDDLVDEMVTADLQLARRDATIAREGFKTHRYHE